MSQGPCRTGSGPCGGASARARAVPERGAALVVALLVMAMLLLLGTSFLTVSSTELEIARNAHDATHAFYQERQDPGPTRNYAVSLTSLSGEDR